MTKRSKSDHDVGDARTEGVANSSRRKFMARATLALGGIIGLVTAIPLVRYFWHPVGRRIVQTSGEPIDVMAAADLKGDGVPVKLRVVANGVRDAWNVADNVPLGSVWLRKQGDEISCFTATCPHLGCAVDLGPEGEDYRCPCHRSSFGLDGEKKGGPSKRGLDSLQHEVTKDGRIKVAWKRYKADISGKEEA